MDTLIHSFQRGILLLTWDGSMTQGVIVQLSENKDYITYRLNDKKGSFRKIFIADVSNLEKFTPGYQPCYLLGVDRTSNKCTMHNITLYSIELTIKSEGTLVLSTFFPDIIDNFIDIINNLKGGELFPHIYSYRHVTSLSILNVWINKCYLKTREQRESITKMKKPILGFQDFTTCTRVLDYESWEDETARARMKSFMRELDTLGRCACWMTTEDFDRLGAILVTRVEAELCREGLSKKSENVKSEKKGRCKLC